MLKTFYFIYLKMKCTKCWSSTRVIDSRDVENSKEVRRRRQCEKCWYKFTTYEKPEITRFVVIKSSWWKELYDRDKLIKSIIKAANKTDFSLKEINNIVSELELSWMKNKNGITSKRIWKDIIEELKNINKVAAIRYASVYLSFKDEKDFIKFIQDEIDL